MNPKLAVSSTDRKAVQTLVLLHNLHFRPGTHRYKRSALTKRLRAYLRRCGIVAMTSRNWVVCLPGTGQDAEQARVQVAQWLIDQPELEAFSSYLPAVATDVLRQRHRLQPTLDPWPLRHRDVAPEKAAPLLSVLCGYALSAAIAFQGGAQ